MKKKFVQIGLGGRSEMYWKAIATEFKDDCELLGICDSNAGRLELRRRELEALGVQVRVYAPEAFDTMIAECRPDTVIVTTIDRTHHQYICRAMELGCDALTEKPMTTDVEKCTQILRTEAATGKKCTVTFNYRYSPPRSQLKEMLISGLIGNVVSVDFHWMLNTSHGADYFRRWHRNKANSGGLMVHKATHHFDLVNWWLSSVPEEVFAVGRRNFYRPETADRYGLTRRGERCHTCEERTRCPFFFDMAANAGLRELYLEQEGYDGYFRDRCVFSEEINIEDTMNVVVSYRSGASMSYSLNAFMPWEGFTVSFNGTRGRIEHLCQETVYVNGDGKTPGELIPEGTWTRVFPHFSPAYEVDVWTGAGGHGGGDSLLLQSVLSSSPPKDKYLRAADHRAGAWSIITGIAANQSMATRRPVSISSLLPGLAEPDYPEMPRPFSRIADGELSAILAGQRLRGERA